MVPHGDGFCSCLLHEPTEVLIPEFSCCHLDAHLLCLGIFLGVEVCLVEFPSHLSAKCCHELLVAHAFFAPKVEVAVGSHDLVADVVEHPCKAHGVGTATEADYHSCTVAQKGVGADETHDFFLQILHKVAQN